MAIRNFLVKRPTSSVFDDMQPHVISERLKTLFKEHIGSTKAVTMPEIYEHVYNSGSCSKLQYLFRCQKIMGVMTWLKKKTHYFIVGEKTEDEYIWYIVKTSEEARLYKTQVDTRIRGLEHMKSRCDKAIRESFYRKLDVPVRKRLKRVN